MQKKVRRLPPVHPGEVLREELLVPLAISINRLGRDLRVPVTRMSEIVVEDLPEKMQTLPSTASARVAVADCEGILPLEEVERRHILRVLSVAGETQRDGIDQIDVAAHQLGEGRLRVLAHRLPH